MEKEFCDIVHSSWSTPVLPSLDPMASLTFKLKRLKGIVKDWEKKMNLAKAKEAKEVDLVIQDLLTSRSSGILSVIEASQLSQLKSRKKSLLAHQILT